MARLKPPNTRARQSQPLRLSPEGVQLADQIGVKPRLDQLSGGPVQIQTVTDRADACTGVLTDTYAAVKCWLTVVIGSRYELFLPALHRQRYNALSNLEDRIEMH